MAMRVQSAENAVDIIIPVKNRYELTRSLLESIYRYADLPFHIYVIDSASTDETADLGKIYTRDITVVQNRMDVGWSAGINQGVELGQNPYVIFVSNSLEISRGWPGNMISFLNSHPRIGGVGPLCSNPDNWQSVDRVRKTIAPQIPRFLTDDLHERNRILKYHFHRAGILVEESLSLSCIALRRRTVEDIGPLNKDLTGPEDGDYCRRLRKAGYVLGLSLDTYVQNRSVAATKVELSLNNRIRARRDIASG